MGSNPIRATDRVVVGPYAMFTLRSALICCGNRFSAKRFSDCARRLAANTDGARRRSSTGRILQYRSAMRAEVQPPSACRSNRLPLPERL